MFVHRHLKCEVNMGFREYCLTCKVKFDEGEQSFTVRCKTRYGVWAILGFQCQHCKDTESKGVRT